MDGSEKKVTPLGLDEGEKQDEETDLDSLTGSPSDNEKLLNHTQLHERVIEHNSDSAADYQSDSSFDSYFRVSTKATFADLTINDL